MLTLRFAAGFAAQLALCCWSRTSPPCSRPTSATACSGQSSFPRPTITGLFNTRGFAIAANRLFSQATRYGRPASVLMIDSDNLKHVNDTHGHEAGSRLLRQVANAVQAELRSTDVPARYGGDEFMCCCPKRHRRGARRGRAHSQRHRLAARGERRAHLGYGEHRHRLLSRGRPPSTPSPRAPTARSTSRSRKAAIASSGSRPPKSPTHRSSRRSARGLELELQYSPVSFTPKLACFSSFTLRNPAAR